MPNVYQIAERYRKSLAKSEAKAVKRLVASYKTVFDALNAEMVGILAGAKADSSSVYRARRMATFLAQAEDALRSVAPDAVDVVTAGQSQAVRDAVKAASEQLKAAGVPVGAGIKAGGGIEGFADRAVAAYVGTAGNGSPLTELFNAVTTDGARIAHGEMTKALALGFGIDRTGEMLRNAIGVSLTRAMTIARTESMRAYRGAHIGYLRENSEHIAGWVWHADHGWRTCPVCLAMDGTFHKLSEDFASHPNCRCSPISIAKGPDGKPEIPDRETGEQWFVKRSAEEQRMLLGPGKYALYKDGKIEMADLVRVGKDPKWGPYRVERSLKDVEARLGGGSKEGEAEVTPAGAIDEGTGGGRGIVPPKRRAGATGDDPVDRMPDADRATIDSRKVTEYFFNQSSTRGWSKGQFLLRFGFTEDQPEILLQALLDHGRNGEVVKTTIVDEARGGGVKWEIRGSLQSPDGRNPIIRTTWQRDSDEETPHFVTATFRKR